MKTYKVYYMNHKFFLDGSCGYEWLKKLNKLPTADTLDKSHTFLREVKADGLDAVFYEMQGEVWSPNGEARPLIESLGLSHTSMSVGDIAVSDGVAYLVDRIGFRELYKEAT
jgi:hypothetical protein